MTHRVLSVLLCIVLAIASCFTLTVPVCAENVTYSGSSSYMSGPYYRNLTAVNLTGNQADDIVNVALSQEGYHEGSSNNDLSGTSASSGSFTEYGYKMGSNPADWCAYFVSWCARRAGISSDIVKSFAGCTEATVNFKSGAWNSAGVWHDGYILNHNTTYIPKKGDLIFYDWEENFYYNSPSDYLAKGVNHVGIVWKDATSPNTVCVIEGNTRSDNDKTCAYVAKKTVGSNRAMSEIVGYFSPAYTGASSGLGTVSITSPSNMQYVNPMKPGSVSWSAYSGAKTYSYTVLEVTYNQTTGEYDSTGNYLCKRVNTTAKSFSLNKDENSSLSGFVRNWGAYKIWIGAFSDTSCNTLIAENIIYVCMKHIAKTPDLQAPFVSSKIQIKSNLYTDTYSGIVSPEQDLTVSWTNIAQKYDYAVKALSGTPNPASNDESGSLLVSGDKKAVTSVTVSAAKLKNHAGKYIKVYLKAYDTTCDDESCSAYYYFKLDDLLPEETYTLTYNANGGSGAPAAQSGATTYTVSSGVPNREGYTFLGWARSRYATAAEYSAGDSITLTKDTTLYAVWDNPPEDQYGVFFSVHQVDVAVNDFSETITITTEPANQLVSVSIEDDSIAVFGMERGEGITTVDCRGKAAGTTVLTATMQYGGKTYTDNCTVRVYAAQNPCYFIHYDLNGGTATPPPPDETDGTTYVITSVKPNRNGFIFLGWSENKAAKTASYEAGDTITPTYNMTLYAVWKQDDTPDPPAALIAVSVQSMPIKTVYTIGEAFDPNGLTLTATYSNGSIETITSGFTCTGFSSAAAGNKTITVSYAGKTASFVVAVIPPTVYTLTYDANGGTGAPAQETGNGTITLSTVRPVRDDHVFLGWAVSSTGSVQYLPGTLFNLTTNTTLYAVWQETPDEPAAEPIVGICNYVPARTVDYRATITFAVNPIQNPVFGAQVHWFIDGQDQSSGDSFTVREAKESYTVQAKYMQNGKVLAESETEKVNVKTGFFARLKAFFRALFGRLPKEVQEAYNIEFYLKYLP